MKLTLSLYDFRDAFYKMGRKEQFSYDGLAVLFDYLEELDENFELDVIGLCCDFAESDWKTIADDYRIKTDGDEDERRAQVIEHLCDEGAFVGETATGDIVYRQF